MSCNQAEQPRIRVFVAGPIETSGDRDENVLGAAEVGRQLVQAGFAPLVPHTLGYVGDYDREHVTREEWYEVALVWVMMADALLRLPGESIGAGLEAGLAEDCGIPIYYGLNDLIDNPPPKGDLRFDRLARRLVSLHNSKQSDYGLEADKFANVTSARDWGVPPWIAAMVRANDKVKRLQKAARGGQLTNETIIDSFMDLANYTMIAQILYEAEVDRDKAPALAPMSVSAEGSATINQGDLL